MSKIVDVPHISDEFIIKFRGEGKANGDIKCIPIITKENAGGHGSYYAAQHVFLVNKEELMAAADYYHLSELIALPGVTQKEKTIAGRRYAVKVLKSFEEAYPSFKGL